MLVLALLFIVVPFVELFVILQTAQALGGWNTLGLLVVISVVGAWLMKREGRKVLRRFTEQINAGVVPTNDIADGVLLLGAGALMLTPGFLTDIVGILAIFPPTRAVLRKLLVAQFVKRSGAGGLLGSARFRRTGSVFNTTVHDPQSPPPDNDPSRELR